MPADSTISSDKSGIAPVLRRFGRIWKPDWSQNGARVALRCQVAIGFCLAAGLAIGSPEMGAVAASGALGAGFGAFERIRGSSLLPMLLGSLGMGLSVFAGALFGYSDFGFIALAAFAGLVAGVLAAMGDGMWYVALQWAIAALVVGANPRSPDQAALLTTLVMSGGLLQTLVIVLFRRFRPIEGLAPDLLSTREGRRFLKMAPLVRPFLARLADDSGRVWKEAARIAFALALAALAARMFGLPHAYWAPMTALLVLKSDLHLTVARGVARMSGTLVGMALVSTISIVLHPAPVVLCLMGVLFAWLCFTLLKVNYAMYSVCITAFVVSQLELGGLTGYEVAKERALGTLLGVSGALLAQLLPHAMRHVKQDTAAD